MVEVNCETDFVAKTDAFKELVKDIAMHIAATNPSYLKREEVPTAELEHEQAVLAEQARNEGKPEKIIEKMVAGRIEKYYKEVCLMEQPFVKDPDKTISDLITESIAKIGENISIRRFTRYQLGEGIEKKRRKLCRRSYVFRKIMRNRIREHFGVLLFFARMAVVHKKLKVKRGNIGKM